LYKSKNDNNCFDMRLHSVLQIWITPFDEINKFALAHTITSDCLPRLTAINQLIQINKIYKYIYIFYFFFKLIYQSIDSTKQLTIKCAKERNKVENTLQRSERED